MANELIINVTPYEIRAALIENGLIGFVLVFAVMILDIVVTIIATVEENQGKYYRYPMSIRFIS